MDTVQTYKQLTPPTQNGTEAEVFRGALRARAQAELDRMRKAEHERDRFAAEVENAKAYLTALVAIFRAEGMEPLYDPDAEPVASRVGLPGNKSSNVPPRREPFTTMRLPDAVEQILADGEQWHADHLVDAIFDAQNVKQHKAAKATLASALSAGANKGRWERVAGNTFQRLGDQMPGDI